MAWTPPTNYQPKPGYPDVLSHISPSPLNSALGHMFLYWQWTRHWSPNKSSNEAWNDLHISPDFARKAIDEKVAPPEIFPKLAAVGQQA